MHSHTVYDHHGIEVYIYIYMHTSQGGQTLLSFTQLHYIYAEK